MDGGMTIKGGNLYDNKALASLIAEFHDSTFSQYIFDVHIYNNTQISIETMRDESWRCDILCFIDKEYLVYYGSILTDTVSLNWI